MSVATTTAIRLETSCAHEMCDRFAVPLYEQMSSGRYDKCSVMEIPLRQHDWKDAHRTARKRWYRAARRGYWADPLNREDWNGDIHAINTSAPTRQGRPMSDGYTVEQEYGPLPDYPCARHAIRTTGVWAPSGELVGYLNMYRCGELALVSQILGHADHLENEIMYLLFARALWREPHRGYFVYNRHDSGTDGLRFFKERLGFTEQEVEWLP